jgi:hypothetical protein
MIPGLIVAVSVKNNKQVKNKNIPTNNNKIEKLLTSSFALFLKKNYSNIQNNTDGNIIMKFDIK